MKNLLKTGLVLAFILLAGVLYSCREVKEPDTAITLKSKTAVLATGEADKSQTTKDSAKAKQAAVSVAKENQTTNDVTKVSQTTKDITKNQTTDEVSSDTFEYICVHICGAVKKPDVYEVRKGTRLVEAIKLAGGLTEDAAGDYVNQAALVEDGRQVYIPTKDEVKGIMPDGFLGGGADASNSANDNTTSAGSTANSGKVNINTASEEELMTLSGIGESKAASIIAYRKEHGSFKSIEEIKNINGIKDSVFNKISNMITIN